MKKFGVNTVADNEEYVMSETVKYADDMMLFIEWPYLMAVDLPVPSDSMVKSLDEISDSVFYRRMQLQLSPKRRKDGHHNSKFLINYFTEKFTKFTA
jgi:hypothetical protein